MTATSTDRRPSYRSDPRDPEVRLSALFDQGTLVPMHARDTSGVLTAHGRINGAKVIAYCSDAARMGGAMGPKAARTWSSPSTRPCGCAAR